jgi:hypothetical protein
MKEENKLFYIGKFGETVETPEENSDYIKEAVMFSTGVHRGVEYTEDDLNELVNNFSADEEIPVQIDHSESARDTVGYIQDASVKDGKLLGKVKIIDKFAQERIDQGLMKKLSVSFYLKYSEEGIKPHKIREVSLVAFPQVKGAQLFSENGFVSNYEEKEDITMTFDLEKFKEEQKALLEQEIHAEYAEAKAKAEQFETLQAQFKEQQVTAKIEKFQADSKVIPAQADALKALLTSFSEEQTQLFEDFMANSAKVDFEEEGEVEQPEKAGEGKSQAEKDFDAFFEEYTKKHGASL